MVLVKGSRVGPFEILSPIGAGGMGEVFRAHDARLNRDVAIKVLPPEFAQDKERLARFRREAQVLASLSHPNIAAIFGLEESSGVLALALELVEGEDLSERLTRGPIPIDDAIDIARQIAEGLEAAHEKGIVHRDLKPANVKLTGDGVVKILDFGLARASDGDPVTNASSLANSPTMARPMTDAGMILGTAAYMSPEQARGKTVDKRSDIWSYGVVLYELLTGRRLFAGDTVTDTLAAVLRQEVDLHALPAETPASLRSLLARCLNRDPKQRLRDIGEARVALHAPSMISDVAISTDGLTTASRSSWPARLAWFGAGLLLSAGGSFLLAHRFMRPAVSRPPVVRTLTYSGTSGDASMSRDGKFVAFSSTRDGTSRIWLKQLATGEEVALTAGNDFGPRISPDSSTVIFVRAAEVGVDLYRVPLVGGEPRRLARNVGGAEWSPDGKRLAVGRNLAKTSEIVFTPAEGGEEKRLIQQEDVVRGLSWSPDGQNLLFVSFPRSNSISSTKLRVVDVSTGARRDVYRAPAGSVVRAARWDGNDAIIFAWAPSPAGHDEALLEYLVLGSPTPVPLFSFTSVPQRMEVVGEGSLLFDQVSAHQNLFETGASVSIGRALTSGPTLDRQPSFSPDGKRVVFTSDRSGSLDLWSLEIATGALRRLTFDAASDWDPHWSPDGKHLLWSSNRSGHFEIWMADQDGSGARQVTSDGIDAENPTMSADGSWIVFTSSNPSGRGIWKIRPDGTSRTKVLVGNFVLPELASGSGWIAAVEILDTFTSRIHVVALADSSPIARLTMVSRNPNPGRSRWMADGRTLVFFADDEKGKGVLYRQPVIPGTNTDAQRTVVAVSDEQRGIESFAVSPTDGRIVLSAGGTERDVFLATGIPGIGESLRKENR